MIKLTITFTPMTITLSEHMAAILKEFDGTLEDFVNENWKYLTGGNEPAVETVSFAK